MTDKAYTILVVDDSADDRELLTQLLTDEGFTVQSQADGATAVELLESGACKPDLILMDMMMEKMSGHMAFNIIKSNPSLTAIPFVFVTGRDRTRDLFDVRKADDFIVKPIDPDNFILRIKKVLEKK